MKKIALSGKKGNGKFILVDDEDYPILSRIQWSLHSEGYAKNGRFYIHSLILGFPKGVFYIDHKDGNKLNNQKCNIRAATQTGNCANRPKNIKLKLTSKFKGVYWNQSNQRWAAQVGLNGKKLYLGGFDNEHHAALVYDMWALEVYGKFAQTNFKIIAHG